MIFFLQNRFAVLSLQNEKQGFKTFQKIWDKLQSKDYRSLVLDVEIRDKQEWEKKTFTFVFPVGVEKKKHKRGTNYFKGEQAKIKMKRIKLKQGIISPTTRNFTQKTRFLKTRGF